jgi:hypothetical protein
MRLNRVHAAGERLPVERQWLRHAFFRQWPMIAPMIVMPTTM